MRPLTLGLVTALSWACTTLLALWFLAHSLVCLSTSPGSLP